MPADTAEDLSTEEGGYPGDVFERLASLETGHFWFEARNQLIIWAIRRYFPNAKDFLDVGCGTGFVLQGVANALPQLVLSAVERNDEGLAIARRRVPSARFFQQDVRRLSFECPVDLAGIFDVLEHIADDGAMLTRLAGVVRPGGGLLLTVPQHPWLWSHQDDFGQHVRRYRRKELLERLHAAGFETLRMSSFVSLPLPLLVLSRLMRPIWSADLDPWREFDIPPQANRGLRTLLNWEQRLIRMGFSWPAGGSLFVVARRPNRRHIPTP